MTGPLSTTLGWAGSEKFFGPLLCPLVGRYFVFNVLTLSFVEISNTQYQQTHRSRTSRNNTEFIRNADGRGGGTGGDTSRVTVLAT